MAAYCRLLALACGVAAVLWGVSPTLLAGDREAPLAEPTTKQQQQDGVPQDAAGEDELDRLLRRFGERGEGLKERIDASIDKGVAYLASQQRRDGTWDLYLDGYALGGTALCALAIKKSLIGLYEGTERDLERDIRRLERFESSGRMTPEQRGELAYLRTHGARDIARRAELQPRVDRAIEVIRERYQQMQREPFRTFPNGNEGPNYRVYEIGAVLMLLEAQHTRRVADRRGHSRVELDPRGVPREDLEWIREMVRWLESTASPVIQDEQSFAGRGWRYPAGSSTTVDLSCTQYAVLGLRAAARMGVRTSDGQLWLDVLHYVLEAQCEDGPPVPRRFAHETEQGLSTGSRCPEENREIVDQARGWGYRPLRTEDYRVSGSMTTAGIAVVIIAASELQDRNLLQREPELSEQIGDSIHDGLAWLAHHFAVRGNPRNDGSPGGSWHHYYLYGLERAGVLAQTEFIGEHAWYLDGVDYLLRRQADNGSWKEREHEEDNRYALRGTSFAILFLKRATVPLNVPLGPTTTGGSR